MLDPRWSIKHQTPTAHISLISVCDVSKSCVQRGCEYGGVACVALPNTTEGEHVKTSVVHTASHASILSTSLHTTLPMWRTRHASLIH